jgi:Skp family chaperone for outer membrane proteins
VRRAPPRPIIDGMTKILLMGLIALMPTSATAAGDVGYVNISKAIHDTAEGKKAFAEIEDVAKQHQADVTTAATSARAAAAKCATLTGPARKTCDATAQKADADANDLVARFNKDIVQRQNAVDQRVGMRALRILPKIATAHKLIEIRPADAALYVGPKADFTAELVKRYDAGEGKTDEDLAAELRDKNAALEGEKVAQAKRNAELEAKVAALEKAAAKPATGKN